MALSRVSYGHRRIQVLLRREGWPVNHKRVYRFYRLEGLGMQSKKPRRYVTGCRRMERVTATHPNECWSMDFMSDELYNGQRIRLLPLVDNYTRESLDRWAYINQVELDFSRPRKPVDNAYIESFNGSFRDECLNQSWFLSLEDAKEKGEKSLDDKRTR
jgi:putative transposase